MTLYISKDARTCSDAYRLSVFNMHFATLQSITNMILLIYVRKDYILKDVHISL